MFDESKVINALHVDRCELGKRYYYANNINSLVASVAEGISGILVDIKDGNLPFIINGIGWQLVYPAEKKRMTNRQFTEWLAKGNGEWAVDSIIKINFWYSIDEENDEVNERIMIRTWRSNEFMVPTQEIYERDCGKIEESE